MPEALFFFYQLDHPHQPRREPNIVFKNVTIGFVLFLVLPVKALCLGTADTRLVVEEFFNSYLAAFAARDAELVAEKYFLAPMYLKTGSEMVLLRSRESVIEHLSSVFTALSRQSYSRTEIVTKNICVLSNDSAIVSVVLRRYDSEGVVLLDSGASYSIVKLGGHWRFPMAAVHSPELVVLCGA